MFDILDKIIYYNSMRSEKSIFFLILTVILIASCRSEPKTILEANTSPSGNTETSPQQTVETTTEAFDTRTVSQAQHDSTLDEVQRFIGSLNDIISNKNYNSWKAALSQAYFTRISSSQFLREMSDQPAMKTRNIVLRTPEDYFTNVVVPSRADSHVEDIEFIESNRVKAFTVTKNSRGEEQWLVLYDLEKVGNSWLIVN
jgi:hypothetical protein